MSEARARRAVAAQKLRSMRAERHAAALEAAWGAARREAAFGGCAGAGGAARAGDEGLQCTAGDDEPAHVEVGIEVEEMPPSRGGEDQPTAITTLVIQPAATSTCWCAFSMGTHASHKLNK